MKAIVRALYPIRERIALSWLHGLRDAMQRRIDAGDLDFDDIVYRSRDAADTLIEVWDE